MPTPLIDLRSDMLGARSPAVIEAMCRAAGRPAEMDERRDVEIRGLEEEVAATLGQEDAAFLPTCTLANQIALRLAGRRGTTVLADDQSHPATTERDAVGKLQQVGLRLVPGAHGHLSPDQVAAALAAPDRPALVWLENTHNLAGGSVMPPGWQAQIARLCRDAGAHLHLDGTRIWNAAVALEVAPAALAEDADSVSVSLNKAMDAPLGAVLAGQACFVREAATLRRRLGGQWRPVGLLAAAARVALHEHPARIARSHRLARRLADFLGQRMPPRHIVPPETNIVMIRLAHRAGTDAAIAALRDRGVAALGFGGGRIRLVLHSGIDEGRLEAVAEAVAAVLGVADRCGEAPAPAAT